MTHEQELQIGKDLDLCDLMLAIGSKTSKRKAAKQRKICFDAIAQSLVGSSIEFMTDDEILAELGA